MARQLHDEGNSRWNSGRITRILKVCCPAAVRYVRMLGYEQALVIRSFTHLVLWFCALVSFIFSIVWFSDLITLQCTQTNPVLQAKQWCLWEALGLAVFFASFRDSVRMIAHFDDDRQHVLREKWRTLDALKLESQQVLDSAKANVEKLRDKVVRMMEVKVAAYTQEVFTIILQAFSELRERAQEQGSESKHVGDIDALAARLASLVRSTLVEVDELATVMLQELINEHPEVFKRTAQSEDDRDSFQLDERQLTARQSMRLWDEWLHCNYPHFIAINVSASPDDADDTEDADALRHARMTEKSLSTSASLAQQVGKSVMQPVDKLLCMPEQLEQLREDLLDAAPTTGGSTRGRGRQRVGIGCPPWGGICSCCIPGLIAGFCRSLLTPCRACCPCARRCCRSGLRYDPPKRMTLGCFWVQIYTKLHERLIQGLLFSMLYCAFYLYALLDAVIEFGDKICGVQPVVDSPISQCFLQISRRSVAAISLLCYIPALAVCLYYIDRLDAVMETIETIWELQDIERAARAFDRRMEEVAEQVTLLKDIEDRVLTRIDVVRTFGGRVGAVTQRHVTNRDTQLLEATRQLLFCLESAADEMKPAGEWIQLSSEEQAEISHRVKEAIKDLSDRNFGIVLQNAPHDSPRLPRDREDSEQSQSTPRTHTASSQSPSRSFQQLVPQDDSRSNPSREPTGENHVIEMGRPSTPLLGEDEHVPSMGDRTMSHTISEATQTGSMSEAAPEMISTTFQDAASLSGSTPQRSFQFADKARRL